MMTEKKGFFRGLLDKMAGSADGSPDHGLASAAGQAPAPVLEPAVPASAGPVQEKPRSSFFERLKHGLSKTSASLVGRIDQLVLGKKKIDAETLEELEEILITADLGVNTAVDLIRTLEQRLKRNELADGAALRAALQEEILARLLPYAAPLEMATAPYVIMVIGV
ncbi:MAG TPA: signal recognition particle receptor subunit alpha, partial [Geobacteraceae bacterium]